MEESFLASGSGRSSSSFLASGNGRSSSTATSISISQQLPPARSPSNSDAFESASMSAQPEEGGCCRRRSTAATLKLSKKRAFETMDFDGYSSIITEAHTKSQSSGYHQRTECVRFVVVFFIGLMVALVAVSIISGSRILTGLRYESVTLFIGKEAAGESPQGSAFSVFWAVGLAYAVCAAIPALIEPASAGSGIPEVKMLLNGVKVPLVTRLKTMACRIIGNIFAASSGLPAAYEGPMMTIGASIGAGLSQGKSTTLGFDTRWSVYTDFRNDEDKRDFIAVGVAAGIAAAFNAPVGGTLFAYEEGASYFTKKLMISAFFWCQRTL